MLKTFLKNARQALNEKDNSYCISQCESALEIDSKSYNAYVFLALAHTNLAAFELGEKNYEKAIALDQKNLLAWQGLLNLHHKANKVSKYIDISSRIAAIYAEDNDTDNCLKVIEKAVAYAKESGNTTEISQALRLILPVSPFFQMLEDKLPGPVETYLELSELLEEQEATSISKEIAKGRSRLGVKLDQLTSDVKRQTYESSQLEAIYEEIINWSLEEAVRRDAEAKLLSHAIDRLKVSQSKEKPPQLARIMTIARGMAIVKVANHLPWNIVLDYTDTDLQQLDLELLINYTTLFPEMKFSKALMLYIRSTNSPFPSSEVARFLNENDQKTPIKSSEMSDVLAAFLDVYESDEPTALLLCQRIIVSLYTFEQDWSVVMDFSESCSQQINTIKQETSASLQSVEAGNDLCMARALTYYRTPKFHSRAFKLLDTVVSNGNEGQETEALIGQARILKIDGRYTDSQSLLATVLKKAPENAEALLELAECAAQDGRDEQALSILAQLCTPREVSLSRGTLATIYYYIGRCKSVLGRQTTDAYAAYIQSLRYNMNHAPTYTALGLYYADVQQDVRRAEKCFQKALELSSAELVAAQRLASTFADDANWDLVEIIAQRVIKGNERLQVSWPYRAIGFVHLNTNNYQSAVSAFQSGLRLASSDIDAWIGLGESYLELGRYQAAEKAFARARLFEPDNWHARFLSATVATALGEHTAACSTLEDLVKEDEDSLSLKSSLSVAYLSCAKHHLGLGWYSKAKEVLLKTLELSLSMMSLDRAGDSIFPYDCLGRASKLLAGNCIISDTEFDSVLDRLESICQETDLEQEFITTTESPKSVQSRYALLSIRANLCCIETQDLDAKDEAVYWFEVGQTLLLVDPYSSTSTDHHRAAITAFRCAVKLDPVNDAFWSALGVATSTQDIEMAQHCLIKAVVLDQKSSKHWTNLGYLYLKLHHVEAANQAFVAAQTLDPSSALAWLGQACIARDIGESDHELFEHALRLGRPSETPLVAIKFVQSALEQKKLSDGSSDLLHSAIWALTQASKGPGSVEQENVVSYLRALLLERASDEHLPINECLKLVEALEEAYENDESAETLRRYCDAKAVLARSHLRLKDYEAATETASSVIELEPSDNMQSLRSCKLVVGLAEYFTNQSDEAIATLQELYEETDNDSEILSYLVQILAASSDEASQSLALELLESNQTTTSLTLLYAALISTKPDANEKHKNAARAIVTDLMLSKDQKVRETCEMIERVLEGNEAILKAQIHLHPTSAKPWLLLARRHDKDRQRLTMMALKGSNPSGEIMDFAEVYLASADLPTRLIGLHLSPQTI